MHTSGFKDKDDDLPIFILGQKIPLHQLKVQLEYKIIMEP